MEILASMRYKIPIKKISENVKKEKKKDEIEKLV